MAYDNEPGEVALRANTLLTDAATLAGELPVATHTDPDLPEALVLEGPFDAARLARMARGGVPGAVARGDARISDARSAAGRASARSLRRARWQEHPSGGVDGRRRRGGRGRAQRAAGGHAHAHRAAAARPQHSCRGRRRRGEAPGGSGIRPCARRSALLWFGHAAGARRSALARDPERTSAR